MVSSTRLPEPSQFITPSSHAAGPRTPCKTPSLPSPLIPRLFRTGCSFPKIAVLLQAAAVAVHPHQSGRSAEDSPRSQSGITLKTIRWPSLETRPAPPPTNANGSSGIGLPKQRMHLLPDSRSAGAPLPSAFMTYSPAVSGAPLIGRHSCRWLKNTLRPVRRQPQVTDSRRRSITSCRLLPSALAMRTLAPSLENTFDPSALMSTVGAQSPGSVSTSRSPVPSALMT